MQYNCTYIMSKLASDVQLCNLQLNKQKSLHTIGYWNCIWYRKTVGLNYKVLIKFHMKLTDYLNKNLIVYNIFIKYLQTTYFLCINQLIFFFRLRITSSKFPGTIVVSRIWTGTHYPLVHMQGRVVHIIISNQKYLETCFIPLFMLSLL